MNINELMKQAKQMQAQMDKKKQALEAEEFTYNKQGLELVIKGDRQIKSLKIHEALIDPEDPEILQDLLIVTLNEALQDLEEAHDKITPKQ